MELVEKQRRVIFEELDNGPNYIIVKRGVLLLSPHHKVDSIYLVKSGFLRLYSLGNNGKEFTQDILGQGEIFGEIEIFTKSESRLYAEALTDTKLLKLERKDFHRMIAEKPYLAINFIASLSYRLKETYEISENVAMRNVEERIVYLLLRLAQKYGDPNDDWKKINVKLTHQNIATMIGSSRESVSVFVKKLKDAGIIKKRTYWFVNMPRVLNYLENK